MRLGFRTRTRSDRSADFAGWFTSPLLGMACLRDLAAAGRAGVIGVIAFGANVPAIMPPTSTSRSSRPTRDVRPCGLQAWWVIALLLSRGDVAGVRFKLDAALEPGET